MSVIKKMRIESELTQTELAEKVGVTQGVVSQWEKGSTNPRIKTLKKLASIFGCTIDQLTN